MSNKIASPPIWGMLLGFLLLAVISGASHLFSGPAAPAGPFNIYLTYRGDTSRSIVVNYHLNQRLRDAPDPAVYIDTRTRGGKKGEYARRVVGKKTEVPGLAVYRTQNWIEIPELRPDTTYFFMAGDDANGYTEERSFRTIPAGSERMRFVVGGDVNVTPRAEILLGQAGKQNPLFCAIGGDLAYVNGRLWEYAKWDQWFKNYDTNMRTPEGRMIPMLLAIGNHETNPLPSTDPTIKAPFYTAYFGQQQAEGKTYFSKRFGANLLFIALDTGHVAPHGGEQAAWLAETLAGNEDVQYTFALYHVPLYPSHRPFEGRASQLGRTHWEPLFSFYGLTVAFENHDHTLKRTKLLRKGQPAADGVLYLGDGSFGVDPRTVDPKIRPYLDKQAGLGHFWVVDLAADGITYRAIGESGELLDEYRQTARLRGGQQPRPSAAVALP